MILAYICIFFVEYSTTVAKNKNFRCLFNDSQTLKKVLVVYKSFVREFLVQNKMENKVFFTTNAMPNGILTNVIEVYYK